MLMEDISDRSENMDENKCLLHVAVLAHLGDTLDAPFGGSLLLVLDKEGPEEVIEFADACTSGLHLVLALSSVLNSPL